MKVKIYTLDSFAKGPGGGNPAGVCLDGEKLTERQMRRIAGEIGFSETAFVLPSDRTDFRVRFFTPSTEVELCGHATIAAFSLMGQLGRIRPGTYRQETGAGILAIVLQEDGSVLMEQPQPLFGEVADREAVARSLNLPVYALADDLPVQAVSTGLFDLIVPVKSLIYLDRIEPDFPSIGAISREMNVTGYHLFTEETRCRSTAHCRNFAPLCAIDEEAATGTATGALSAYMYRYGLLEGKDLSDLVFEQGYVMNRPSEIRAELDIRNGEINLVSVGGRAVRTGEREITL